MIKKRKILMASAEVAPFAKVGGLADVVGSLPSALKKLGCDVRIVMPLYGGIDREKFGLKKIRESVDVPSNGRMVKVNIWQGNLPGKGVRVYFIENKKYFGRKEVYGGNNDEKYLFFSQAVVYSLSVIKFQPDVVHCHDNHTGMIPLILKNFDCEYFQNIKTVYTIHNLQYQGKFEIDLLNILNMEIGFDKSLKHGLKIGKINSMRQGIVHADFINTVSPTYAKEIMSRKFGAGLDSLLRKNKNKIAGIINGIDTDLFNPEKDRIIKKKFSSKDLSGKETNKEVLQKQVGLPIEKNIPLVGLVSRFVTQKGLELITEDVTKLNCQFVFLGTGQKEYENILKKLAKKYPEKVSSQILFDIDLAQMIYASSDIFLMPSRFEPCGLGQMIAMRYGTVPVVRSVGGLTDTVNTQTGFSFKNMKVSELKKALSQAIDAYDDMRKWKKLQQRCMKKDFSWTASAKEYLKIYKKV